MHNSRRKVIAGALMLALSFSAVSCSQDNGEAQDGAVYGGEAVVGITQEPMIFDPHTVEEM